MNAGTLRDRIANRRYKYMAFDESELAELAAALDDRDRLEWLEQTSTDADIVTSLVINWTWGGNHYSQGIRAAIDAARGKS